MKPFQGLDSLSGFPDIYETSILQLLARKFLEWEIILDGKLDFSSVSPHCRRPIVYANGCFDLLHAGHIALLLKGKEIAGTGSLVVAVDTDDRVVQRKRGRPINFIGERLISVASLECVDYVTPFDPLIGSELVRALSPDYWLHGFDPEKPETRELPALELTHFKGKIVQIPHCSQLSTTHLIGRVANYLEGMN
jgi:D-beta-D-heptose 7-phosphate kinase/D-beta-D-heptose 1-phosphate adenosyltransferase